MEQKSTEPEPVVEIPGWGRPLSEDEVLANAIKSVTEEYITKLRPMLEKADRTDEITLNCYLSVDPEVRARMSQYWTRILDTVCDELEIGWDWDYDDLAAKYPNPRVHLKSKQVEKDDEVFGTPRSSDSNN